MDKIPFDKKIADTSLTTMHLVIEMAKGMGGSLTVKQLEELKETMTKKYYNENVELLEID